MGKPGHIARKIAASMSSVGIPSFMLHPAEAQHGDLGSLTKNDIVIMLSNSGETDEVCRLLPNLKIMGIPIISITSSESSTLARLSDCVILTRKIVEAGNLGLAPTSSTTVELVIGDAIAIVASEMKNFKESDFALYHPAGALGKKLLTTVRELMHVDRDLIFVRQGKSLKDAIAIMSTSGLGASLIVDEEQYLKGIITDGDLKRLLNKSMNIDKLKVDDVMSPCPISICQDDLAINALKMMEQRTNQIHCLAVVNMDNKVKGLIRNHDVIQAGIFL